MPMNTMLVSRLPSATRRREASRTWSDDLGHLEVPPEPELPGRAERAAHGAAGLARDAQRVPLPRAGTRRVVHQHRFDQRAVGQPVERLLGETAVRLLPLGIGDGVEPERGLEVGAQAGGQRPDLVDRARPTPSRPHRRPGGRGRRDRRAPPARPPAPPGSRRTGRAAAGARRGSCRDASAGGHRPGSMALPAIDGRPRRKSSHGIRRPPAGWTSMSRSRSPEPTPRPSSSNVPAAGPSPSATADQTTRRPNGVSTYEPGHGW